MLVKKKLAVRFHYISLVDENEVVTKVLPLHETNAKQLF